MLSIVLATNLLAPSYACVFAVFMLFLRLKNVSLYNPSIIFLILIMLGLLMKGDNPPDAIFRDSLNLLAAYSVFTLGFSHRFSVKGLVFDSSYLLIFVISIILTAKFINYFNLYDTPSFLSKGYFVSYMLCILVTVNAVLCENRIHSLFYKVFGLLMLYVSQSRIVLLIGISSILLLVRISLAVIIFSSLIFASILYVDSIYSKYPVLDKFENSINEITKEDFDGHVDAQYHWRAYESAETMRKISDGTPIDLIFGHGSGSIVETEYGLPMETGSNVVINEIPVLHNTYASILLKYGLLGLIIFIIFQLIVLYNSVYPKDTLLNTKILKLKLLINATFFVGLYIAGLVMGGTNLDLLYALGMIVNRKRNLNA